MKFDIIMPNSMHVLAHSPQPWEFGLNGADIARAVAVADSLGYWKVMLGEHFIIPKSHVPLSGDHYLHSVSALAFVATSAPRMKLSSGVSILPLQNPIVQAKAWATLDWLSGGRAVALFGVGWLEAEYKLLGVPFHDRGRMCDEYVAAMIELWSSDSPQFAGKYVSFKDVAMAPKPVQKPHLPLWFGGDADNVLKRVARWGHGWSPFQTEPGKIPERLDFIRSQPDYHGRPLEVMFTLLALNVGEAHAVIGDPRAQGTWDAQRVIDQCHWLASLGVTETVVPVPALPDFPAYLDWLRWVAEEIMPHTPD
jgi:probable F420-dependent oxidoreductase